MKEQRELFEVIDNYLNDRMPEEERIAIEKKIAMDEALAEKVNEARSVNDAIYYASLADLKKTIGQDVKKINYKQDSTWTKTNYLFVAAAVLVSALSVYFIADNSNVEKAKTVSEKVIKDSPSKKIIGRENYNPKSGGEVKEKISQAPASRKNQTQETIDPGLKPSNESDSSEIHIQQNDKGPNLVASETKVIPIGKDSSVKNTEPSLKEGKIICNKLFEIHTAASCKQKETGSITIVTDGSKEFHFKVDHFNASGTKGFFQNLPSGKHEVLVTYNKECSYAKIVTVEEKWCPMNNSFSFNPDYHEQWEIQYEQGASGTFSIYDRSGKEIYRSTFGAGNERWNGTATQGNVVAMGTYLAIISYSDGRKEKVELTIVR